MELYYNMNPSDSRNGRNPMNTNCRPPVKPVCPNCQDRDYPIKSGCASYKNMGVSCRVMKPEPRQKTCDCNPPHDKHCHKHDPMEQLGRQFPTVMAYVPWQQWGDLYDADCALREGTIFKELNQIFCGVRC